MGSPIEFNDTLQLTIEQGFPANILNRESHCKNPLTANDLKGREFTFKNKFDARIFHLDPVRVFLVHNIDGKWLFWGHALIQKQEIKKVNPGPGWKLGDWETTGTYTIEHIYDPDFQQAFTINESPAGRSYF